jgi:UDP-glucose 4-epimerase
MVFNGGTGARITLNEVIKLLEKVTGRRISAKYDPPRPGDIRHSQADISLASRVLGYQPLVYFEEGLRRTWEWYNAAYGGKRSPS